MHLQDEFAVPVMLTQVHKIYVRPEQVNKWTNSMTDI